MADGETDFMLRGCYSCRYKKYLHAVPQKFGSYVEKWTLRDSENGNFLYVTMAHIKALQAFLLTKLAHYS